MDPAATLVERHLPLARSLASRYARTADQREELAQVGALGLVAAAHRFDPGRSVPFVAYAIPTVEGEIRRFLRDRSTVVRVPRTEKGAGRTPPLPLPDVEERPSPLAAEELERCEGRVELRRGLDALPPRERAAVGLRYVEDLSQREIADRLHISQSQASRLLASALERLRRELAGRDGS